MNCRITKNKIIQMDFFNSVENQKRNTFLQITHVEPADTQIHRLFALPTRSLSGTLLQDQRHAKQ